MRSALIGLSACGLIATAAHAQNLEESYDWEDGGDVLGVFEGNAVVSYDNSTDQAHSGNASLRFTEEVLDGTPQAYVAFIENLVHGDTITAGFWVYDVTPDASPSGRIWAHYADSGDVMSYRGSASGNETYSDGSGWSYLEFTWTFESDPNDPQNDPPRDALVIEARIYSSNPGDTIYVDDITVSVQSTSGDATITFPSGDGGGDEYDLTVGPLVGGQNGDFLVTGATPNQMQFLAYSLRGLGSTPVPQLGVTLDLNRPSLAGQSRANGQGEATWTLRIPSQGAGRNVWFQVAEQGNVSDVEMTTIQ